MVSQSLPGTSMITEARPHLAPRLELANSNAPLMHRHIAWQGRSSGETVAKGRDPKVPVPDMLAIRPSALGRHCPACRSSALALSVAVDGQLAPSTGACPSSTFRKARFSFQIRLKGGKGCSCLLWVNASRLGRSNPRRCGSTCDGPEITGVDSLSI